MQSCALTPSQTLHQTQTSFWKIVWSLVIFFYICEITKSIMSMIWFLRLIAFGWFIREPCLLWSDSNYKTWSLCEVRRSNQTRGGSRTKSSISILSADDKFRSNVVKLPDLAIESREPQDLMFSNHQRQWPWCCDVVLDPHLWLSSPNREVCRTSMIKKIDDYC